MKRELPPIAVKSPCPKQWADMRGDAKTRFCDHCQLHVHNLSAMSRRDLSGFGNRSQTKRVCVTYTLRRDGTMVTRLDSMIETLLRAWRRGFAWALATVVSIAFSAGVVLLLLFSLGPPLPYYRLIIPVIDGARTTNGLSRLEIIALRFLRLPAAFALIAIAFVTRAIFV